MNYVCELIQQTAIPVLSVRTRTSVANLPQTIGNVYGLIMQYMSEIGEAPKDAPFVAYYNMDMEDLDVEIGFPVSKVLKGKNEIKSGETPAGKYAVCLYTGPYSKCEPAYTALTKWIGDNGYTPTGVVYEYYLNDPDETPENELQTKIAFVLA